MIPPLLPRWSDRSTPVIGMLHLPPLPGAPGFGGDLEELRRSLLADLESLERGGVDGLLLENYGDVPFYPGPVPVSTVAHMSALACEVRRRTDLPLGINVLRNDGVAALAVAQAAGARFVRVNVLAGARLTDQGIVSGVAHELLRERQRLGAGAIRILADVDVKHSVPLGASRLESEVSDLIERALADGLVVSGFQTGGLVDREQFLRVRELASDRPLLVGSGVTPETAGSYVGIAQGLIVGTALKRDGCVTSPVDADRVRRLMAAVRAAREA